MNPTPEQIAQAKAILKVLARLPERVAHINGELEAFPQPNYLPTAFSQAVAGKDAEIAALKNENKFSEPSGNSGELEDKK